jgi:hypothetical protein
MAGEVGQGRAAIGGQGSDEAAQLERKHSISLVSIMVLT